MSDVRTLPSAVHETADHGTRATVRGDASGGATEENRAPAQGDAPLNAGRIVEHLRAQLSELDRREQSLNAQLSSLDQEQRLFRLRVREFEEEVRERTDALETADERVAAREKLLSERLTVVDNQEQELTRQRVEFERERAELKHTLASEIADDRRQITINREQLAASKTAHEEAVELWHRESKQQADELEARRQTVNAELDERQQHVEREEIDLAKRTRFHEDHLTRFRGELDEQRVELEQDRQKLRIWKEQVEQSIRLRIAHVRRFRDLIEQREESLARGEQALETARLHAEQDLLTQREQLAREQEALEQERVRDRSDARRQQELMRSHSRALDERRKKLDALREEIEQTQRQTLEQQMQLEQARAGFVDEAGQEEAGHRLEQSRKGLLDFHRQLAESMEQRRQEFLAAQRQLQERRIEFRDERETVVLRLTEREGEVERRELRLQSQIVGLHEREHRWQQLRERWRQEKLHAEEIIRALVEQLETALEGCEPPVPTSAGPDELSEQQTAAA